MGDAGVMDLDQGAKEDIDPSRRHDAVSSTTTDEEPTKSAEAAAHVDGDDDVKDGPTSTQTDNDVKKDADANQDEFASENTLKQRKKLKKHSNCCPCPAEEADESKGEGDKDNGLSTQMDKGKELPDESEDKKVTGGVLQGNENKSKNPLRQGLGFILLFCALLVLNQLFIKSIMYFFNWNDNASSDDEAGKRDNLPHDFSEQDKEIQEPDDFAEPMMNTLMEH